MRLVWRGVTTSGTRVVRSREKPPVGTARLEILGALPRSPSGSQSRIFNPCWLPIGFARCAINQHDADQWEAQFPFRASLRWPVCAAHASSPRDTKYVRGLARSRHSQGDRDTEHSTAKKQLAEGVRQTTGGQANANHL